MRFGDITIDAGIGTTLTHHAERRSLYFQPGDEAGDLHDALEATEAALEASGDITAVQVILPNNGGMRVHTGFVTQTSEQAGNGTIWTGTASLQLTGQSLDVETV